MGEAEFPKESDKTIYERDKTAKEPNVPEKAEAAAPAKRPVIKPRKVFRAKKAKIQTEKPLEHRVRHIRLSSKDAADLIRQTVLDYQKELADQPTDDPDKEFADRDKVEKFFARLAKKYSTCRTRPVGGDLDWIHKKTPEQEEVLTEDLLGEIMQGEKFVVREPFKSKLGYHIILTCETQVCESLMEDPKKVDPRYEALAAQDAPRVQAPPSSMDIPT